MTLNFLKKYISTYNFPDINICNIISNYKIEIENYENDMKKRAKSILEDDILYITFMDIEEINISFDQLLKIAKTDTDDLTDWHGIYLTKNKDIEAIKYLANKIKHELESYIPEVKQYWKDLIEI